MIVLVLSALEVGDLLAGKPSKELVRYVKGHLKMEHLLPDDNLPCTVILEHLDDCYNVTYRCYTDPRSAERAMLRLTAEDRELALTGGGG